MLVLVVSIFVFGVVGVVVVSMPGQSLCTGGGFVFLVVCALFVGINWFSLEGHAFHGVDSLV